MKTQFINRTAQLVVGLLFFGFAAFGQQAPIQYFRPYDQSGINVFETKKDDTVKYDGFKFRIGANFKQQFQNITHENSTTALGTPTSLVPIGGGFNLAMANLNFDVQLADGVRVNLISYMSSRHHPEFWVKGGFFQIDKVSFLNSQFMDKLWKNLTLRVGHFEVNYGDQHFRRSDGGNGLYNPFVENLIMDGFTTEIGGELYWQKNGILAMVAMTDGEIQGNVTRPADRSPSFYTKVGFDKQLNEDLRLRLTGTLYTKSSSIRNTLFSGDRTGSHYYLVMENNAATVSANFTSGRFNPNVTDNVQAIMINPFVKFKGFELFGTYEVVQGRNPVENGEIQPTNPALPQLAQVSNREYNQLAVDGIYRFANDKFYVGARYNTVSGPFLTGQTAGATPNQGTRTDVQVNRTALAAGWFLTRNVMFKFEYVTQEYKDFPTGNIFENGKFSGYMLEGIIGF
jgi:hypothetical protein